MNPLPYKELKQNYERLNPTKGEWEAWWPWLCLIQLQALIAILQSLFFEIENAFGVVLGTLLTVTSISFMLVFLGVQFHECSKRKQLFNLTSSYGLENNALPFTFIQMIISISMCYFVGFMLLYFTIDRLNNGAPGTGGQNMLSCLFYYNVPFLINAFIMFMGPLLYWLEFPVVWGINRIRLSNNSRTVLLTSSTLSQKYMERFLFVSFFTRMREYLPTWEAIRKPKHVEASFAF